MSKANNQELESENARLQGELVVLTVWTAVIVGAHVIFLVFQ